jgi:SAM-dependent methyltransferase
MGERGSVRERAVASLRLRALDVADRVAGRAEPLVPSRRLQSAVGQGDYVFMGEEFLGHFRELAGLRPDHRVLDIGCGFGRMARPLAGFLDPAAGSYRGFDVDARGIDWCARRYAGRYPHFRFEAADLRNGVYNPAGTRAAEHYRFPYADDSFDLAFATSVFTHLLAPAAERYLAEAARVLAPGGRLLGTFFVLDDASRRAVADGAAALPFPDPDADVSVLAPDSPEAAIAYDRGWLEQRLAANGLELEGLHPGAWTGSGDGLSYQDIVVARA